MKRVCVLLLVLSSFCLFVFFPSCTDRDVGDIYFGREVHDLDSSGMLIFVSTWNEADRVAIFEQAAATTLVVQFTGFLQKKTLRLPLLRVGDGYMSSLIRLNPGQTYDLREIYLLNEQGVIVGLVPILGSTWSLIRGDRQDYHRQDYLPVSVIGGEHGNKVVPLNVYPALGGNLALTGYDYEQLDARTPVYTTPPAYGSVRFKMKVVEESNPTVSIPATVTIKRKSNGTTVFGPVSVRGASSTILVEKLYYYDHSDLFQFYVEGEMANGHKTAMEEKSAIILMDYDLAKDASLVYVIQLK